MKVDNLPMTSGFNPNDDRRLGAAIVHYSDRMSFEKGHMYVKYNDMYCCLMEGKIQGFTDLNRFGLFRSRHTQIVAPPRKI